MTAVPSSRRTRSSRRQFLQSSAAAAAAAAIAVPAVHAQGQGLLKVGLIGCGGRGTGAANQALRADRNVKLWAMGDAFEDRLERSLQTLQRDAAIANKVDVPAARRFAGFDAYQQVINSGVDVVLLCTPPGFRPLHLRAAVQAGKHIFAEKPVAVDAPGVRSVLATCEDARRRNLSIVSGLCLRFSNAYREMMRRLHDGAIGDPHTLQANDLRGRIWVFPRQEGWTDMYWQMRNWYYFAWLSGDFNVEQHVHNLDVCAWALRDQYPIKAVGLGGRQVRTGPEYGHIYDHFSVIYEYANGTKVFSHTRQQTGCRNDITVYASGTRGQAVISERRQAITGANAWSLRGKDNNFYQTEHDELFASIRTGRPINNGEYMCKSTLMAIMGRMAAYTGREITWDQALNSREDLSPPRYAWDVPLQVPPIARPGVTEFR
ncbi:MAG: Gfo/Idh/MocA family oxidoreductase [Gemmataceae bacterium]|nr:Gfo/Idh/MocA family oxidoreductase [Gemmataceae bacterium]